MKHIVIILKQSYTNTQVLQIYTLLLREDNSTHTHTFSQLTVFTGPRKVTFAIACISQSPLGMPWLVPSRNKSMFYLFCQHIPQHQPQLDLYILFLAQTMQNCKDEQRARCLPHLVEASSLIQVFFIPPEERWLILHSHNLIITQAQINFLVSIKTQAQ